MSKHGCLYIHTKIRIYALRVNCFSAKNVKLAVPVPFFHSQEGM